MTIRKTATDELLEAVGQIKNLREVDIYYSKKVTDAGLRSLAGLTKLEVLNIGWVNSQGDGLASLSGSKLKSLNVTGMPLTEAAAKAIGGAAFAAFADFTAFVVASSAEADRPMMTSRMKKPIRRLMAAPRSSPFRPAWDR